jgi:hypothetical protein
MSGGVPSPAVAVSVVRRPRFFRWVGTAIEVAIFALVTAFVWSLESDLPDDCPAMERTR